MSVEIVAQPHPFDAPVYTLAPEGLTIAEMLTGMPGPVALPLTVFAGDRLVPQDMLHRVRPKAGVRLTVKVTLHGGGSGKNSGGGGGGKDTLRTVLTIAVIAAAIFAPLALPLIGVSAGATVLGGLTAGALATAVVGTAGLLAVNSLVPPRGFAGSASAGSIAGVSGSSSSSRESPNYSISGARNVEQPFGVVPSVLGTNRMVPPLGARTYTEILGNQQYLTMLVVWGYGPLSISDLRIGDTPITSFEGVAVETREGLPSDTPLTLYPRSLTEIPLSVALLYAVVNSRTTAANTDRISIDIAFPAGLVEFDKNGNKAARTVQLAIYHRVSGSGAGFTFLTFLNVTEASTQAVYRGFTWAVARGRYDVAVVRNTLDATNIRIQDQVVWTSMRSFTNEDPIQFEKPLAKSAIRIKATGQLNSAIDQLSGLVTSKVTAWDGDSWEANTASNNPANLMRHVLQGPANAVPVANGDLDLDAFADFADHCSAQGFTFNQIRDFEGSVLETLADIASVGKASPALRDGKWTVLIDDEKSLVVQHFTPRNSWGFSGQKVFHETPHAWRARFINAAKDYQQDEAIVYADGYNAGNATKFEAIEFPGVTTYNQVYKLARYHMAVAQLRPETYTLYTDFENLVCTRGDLVLVAHDVPVWSDFAGGRVTAVAVSGGNIVSVRIDEPCEMVAGQSYVARFRLGDQSTQTLLVNLVTTPGVNSVLQFADTVAEEDGPLAGDLFMFGLLNSESVELIVKSIEPVKDLAARLTLVDHAPAIQDASDGPIPAFDSQITRLPRYKLKPSAPTIETIQSDITVAVRGNDGSITERIVITCKPPSTDFLNKSVLEAQIRFQGADTYGNSISQGLQDQVTIIGVIGGETYDVRVRQVATADSVVPGATSDWFEQLDYFVIGKTDLPDAVAVMRLEENYAVWDYDPPLDFKGFQLRFHRGTRYTWADAAPAHEGYVTETRFDLSSLRGGTFTLLLKAFDSGERESESPATLVVDLGDPIVENVVLETAFADFDFYVGTPQATLTNGVLDGGELEATDTALFWIYGDGGIFWDTLGATLFWDSLYNTMTYETFFVPNPLLGGEVSLETTIQGEAYSIRYRGNGDGLLWNFDSDPMWAADDATLMWGAVPEYRAWPGKTTALKRERVYFQISVLGGPLRPIISEFTARQDVPDVLERFNDIDIAAAGTQLSLTEEFSRILNVSLTLQDDAGTALTARVMDKNAALGPLVKCFNASNVAVDGNIDATVQGY